MKLFYATNPDASGRHLIYYAVLDQDVFTFEHSTNASLSEKTIDEIADNKDLINALRRNRDKVDAVGDHRFYIDGAGEIIEKDGWEEAANV